MPKKKIMVVTPRFPLPLIGGDRIRIFYMCRELAKKYDLDLFSLAQTPEELVTPSDPAVFRRTERFRMPKHQSLLGVARAAAMGAPLQTGYFYSGAMRRRLAAVASEYDAILAHLIRVVPMLPPGNRPVFLEMTDAISLVYERAMQPRAATFKTTLYAFDQPRTRAFELRSAAQVALASLISPVDADYLFGDAIPANVVVAGNGIEIGRYPVLPPSDAPQLLFLGNMGTEQNLDAALYMADQIMPLIDSRFTFNVVGTGPEPNLAKLRARPRVLAKGRVADLAAAAGGSIIAVAPIRIGAGIQNKVLEYLAFGLPAVVSSVAAEGIDAVDGEHLLIADTPAAFAAAITRLAGDRALRVELGRSGRALIEQRYAWSGVLLPWTDRIGAILG